MFCCKVKGAGCQSFLAKPFFKSSNHVNYLKLNKLWVIWSLDFLSKQSCSKSHKSSSFLSTTKLFSFHPKLKLSQASYSEFRSCCQTCVWFAELLLKTFAAFQSSVRSEKFSFCRNFANFSFFHLLQHKCSPAPVQKSQSNSTPTMKHSWNRVTRTKIFLCALSVFQNVNSFFVPFSADQTTKNCLQLTCSQCGLENWKLICFSFIWPVLTIPVLWTPIWRQKKCFARQSGKAKREEKANSNRLKWMTRYK